jgi:hypothetical protein
MATAHAEKIQWADLYSRFAGACVPLQGRNCEALIDNRSINVIARDGTKRHTRKLCMTLDKAMLDCAANKSVPKGDIARIEIRNTGRYVRHTLKSASFPVMVALMACTGWEGGGCNDLAFLPVVTILSPVWAYAAATTPFTLSAEFVTLFIPPKTFEIVH